MHEVFERLRTVAILEFTCRPYRLSSMFEEYAKGYDPSKLAVIGISDDMGYDTGDLESIQKMHQLIIQPNSLYEVLKIKENGEDNKYFYYLVLTEDPEYLSDLIEYAHAQSQVDKIAHKFNEKYKQAGMIHVLKEI